MRTGPIETIGVQVRSDSEMVDFEMVDFEMVKGQSVAEQQTRQTERPEPFRLRGHTYTMMVLRLIDPTVPGFFAKLSDKIGQAPRFFQNVPVILDLDELPGEVPGFTIAAFVKRLRRLRLHAVGVQGGTQKLRAEALVAGLPEMGGGRPSTLAPHDDATEVGVATDPDTKGDPAQSTRPRSTDAAARQAHPASGDATRALAAPTLVVQEPVRSGRQVYAAGGDLVVAAPVSAGAELLADGDIHVYGPLRGRALAGLNGNTRARIFCMSMEAELLSIAGLYRVNEDIDRAVMKRPAQTFLEDGYLKVASL